VLRSDHKDRAQRGLEQCQALVQTRVRGGVGRAFPPWVFAMGQAASAAFHISDMVAFRILSLPVLNWPSANSIPLMVTAALSNRLNPNIG
jgi:hypothetical protein